MNNPFVKLESWLEEERQSGNVFPQGAVLSTVSKKGMPRSRVVGTMLDDEFVPKFHTSPSSRKIEDIDNNNAASLTYCFQNTLRSISIEGYISPLSEEELISDWLKFDEDFRKHYVVFGECSGNEIRSLNTLRERRDQLSPDMEMTKPDSFVGYKFIDIRRISFYSVQESDFAVSVLYEIGRDNKTWLKKNMVP